MAKKKPTSNPETVQKVTFSQILIPIVITISFGLGMWAAIDLKGFLIAMEIAAPWVVGIVLILASIGPVTVLILIARFLSHYIDRRWNKKE